MQEETTLRKERHLFENFIRKHGSDNANPLTFIQFRLNKANWGWSGPLCITSIGCFFLKFRKQSGETGRGTVEFATVNVTEEGSTLAVRFQKPPNTPPPYRIENFLSASLTYYQKVGHILINVIATYVFFLKMDVHQSVSVAESQDSSEIEVLGPGSGAGYAWDDMTLPHKLVVIVDGNNWLPIFSCLEITNFHNVLKNGSLFHRYLSDQKAVFLF